MRRGVHRLHWAAGVGRANLPRRMGMQPSIYYVGAAQDMYRRQQDEVLLACVDNTPWE